MRRITYILLAIIVTITNNSISISAQEAIDLGLPVMWASLNLGAKSIDDFGEYYAWGELEPKTGEYSFTESNYRFSKPGESSWEWIVTKYNKDDQKKTLELLDDAAQVKLGGNWRMPTKEEYEMLVNTSFLQWKWTTLNGVNGYKITSKRAGYEGNWIFIPAAGAYRRDSLEDKNSVGRYWTSSLSFGEDYIHVIDFNESGASEYTEVNRLSTGLPIRPVWDKNAASAAPSHQTKPATNTTSKRLPGESNAEYVARRARQGDGFK